MKQLSPIQLIVWFPPLLLGGGLFEVVLYSRDRPLPFRRLVPVELALRLQLLLVGGFRVVQPLSVSAIGRGRRTQNEGRREGQAGEKCTRTGTDDRYKRQVYASASLSWGGECFHRHNGR